MKETLPPLRILIVDDEPPARERARRMIARIEDAEIVGEAATGLEALHLIESLDPDVILLDIQMPDLTGLRLLDALDDPPAVIFSTAYEEHAVQAFELEAVDYCLKPYSTDRLRRALNRARRHLARETAGQESRNGSHWQSAPQRISAELGRVTERVDVDSILQLVLVEGVVFLHRKDGETLLCGHSLGELESMLPEERFLRISRQAIVHLDCVRSYTPAEQGGLRIELEGGLWQTVSRRRARALRARLQNKDSKSRHS
jgi:two-component system LytT family response regulator